MLELIETSYYLLLLMSRPDLARQGSCENTMLLLFYSSKRGNDLIVLYEQPNSVEMICHDFGEMNLIMLSVWKFIYGLKLSQG